ncbi:cysteine desulfurase [Thiohalocapsa marina]|uniref:cysteine desulfurase n=1 Tax=Thiohalocapsa marina TaxID=424902 RepID=A0A5M8FC14_9GAMM|nr:cysteine desulfurase family protein [Thiohalocapsa marina]KAA6182247.1 cysteine desulfurase [Thiohalocapsa marina]
MTPINKPLYLDTAATTPLAPEVIAVMVEALGDPTGYANPSSAEHVPGRAAAALIEAARGRVARELGCEADEVVFTSGATESINLALRGIALAHAGQGRHIVTSRIEHKATLACCKSLEQEGFEISYVDPERDGRVSPEAIAAALRPDTLLISLMHTNNETGVIQPVEAVAEVATQHGVLLHVDAAQAAGKLKIDMGASGIDLLSLSAHKFHGPKGAGCLLIRDRRRLRLRPLCYGGGQEFGLRPGTLATHQILGLAAALELAAERRAHDLQHVADLKAQFLERLGAALPLQVHGSPQQASPYIVNLSIDGIRSDALINQTAADIAIASGSACSSGTVDPSPVLRAMGVAEEALYGAVRVSFAPQHTPAEIAFAADAIIAAVQRIRAAEAERP